MKIKDYNSFKSEPHYSNTTLLEMELRKHKNDIGYFYTQIAAESGKIYPGDTIFFGHSGGDQGGKYVEKRWSVNCKDDAYRIYKGEELLMTEIINEREENVKNVVSFLLSNM